MLPFLSVFAPVFLGLYAYIQGALSDRKERKMNEKHFNFIKCRSDFRLTTIENRKIFTSNQFRSALYFNNFRNHLGLEWEERDHEVEIRVAEFQSF